MKLAVVGCSYRSTAVEFREKMAFDEAALARALNKLALEFGIEAVILSTCNRVELYLARSGADALPTALEIEEFLAAFHQIDRQLLGKSLFAFEGAEAVKHLFRVAASLDSLIVGEGQIVAQVRKAFEVARSLGTTGPLLNLLFPHAVRSAKRARTETGIARGHVSVSSVAVDYVRQVFDTFADKTILVIGAGKMGQLTLKHLRELQPKVIRVTNRSLEKAVEVARGCGGEAMPWEALDEALLHADIVLSTTGSPEVIVAAKRYTAIAQRRAGRPVVILDIAVPRDFDPAIHDGETTFLFNIDDLSRIREQTIAQRHKHIAPAEAIVEQERRKFVEDWRRREHGPVIEKLTKEFDAKREAVVAELLAKLNGKLSEADREFILGAFRLFQNRLLNSPIGALREASKEGSSASLLEALRKLFRLGE